MNVFLVHGLGRTPLSLLGLGRTLRQQGHSPHYFGYFAPAESYQYIQARLLHHLQKISVQQPYAVVGHSLGGLLLRDTLQNPELPRPVLLAMLGTPNRSPRLIHRAQRYAPFRWVTRECGRKLATASYFSDLPVPDYPYLIVAGTRGWYGLSSLFGHEPNDGIVAVSETHITQADTVFKVPALHSFLMNHTKVQQKIVDLLATRKSPVAS